MRNILLSSKTFGIYASFCTDLAAGWFLAGFIAPDIFALTKSLVLSIMYLYLAIILEHSS